MVYQHPLAYLLGLEGIALLRAFAGEYDRDFTMARLAEVRALLDAVDELGDGTTVDPISTTEGYLSWAAFYDEPGNQLIDLEQPIVREIIDGLPPGVALDAACGTGRHSAYLASLGHTVIGVDSSTAMLERAREKVPDGEFHEGDLHELPLPDDHVDLVVCALALVHASRPPTRAGRVRPCPAPAEVIWSFPISAASSQGSASRREGQTRRQPRLHADPDPAQRASTLAAALPLGLQVRRCEEPRRPFPLVDDDGAFPDHEPDAPPNIWALHRWAPAATNAAYRDNPAVIIWHFQLGSSKAEAAGL